MTVEDSVRGRTRPATIVDVAQAAGVSRTTASDALRKNPKVAPATRERVAAAAERLGYRVNLAARSLRSAETGTLGLHLPEPMTRIGYYQEVVFGALEECAVQGYDVTVITSGRTASPMRFRVDGLILADPFVDDPVAAALLAADLPKVLLEHLPAQGDAVVVSADHERTTRDLLGHFDAQSARRPALLASPAVTDWGKRVQATFRQWCAERSEHALVIDRPFGSTAGDWRSATEQMLDAGADALLCGSVAATMAACEVLEERGLRLGTDVLVASVVDAPELAERHTPVTAVDLRPREAGGECVRALLGVLRGEVTLPAIMPFAVKVRYRASTGVR